MAKTLRIVGLAWCYLVAAIIAVSLLYIALTRGMGEVWSILSPFNIPNVVVTMLALAPGLACLFASDRISQRA